VFVTALRELKSRVPSARGKNKKLNIFVALSSVNMYSQVFTLPFMEEKDLGKAISLNVQMVSPVDINHAYFSWQMLGRDEKNLRSEIAAAFTDKTVVDEMAQALYSAGSSRSASSRGRSHSCAHCAKKAPAWIRRGRIS